jgi:hypothetical protein
VIDHRRQIYITGTHRHRLNGKERTGLILSCMRCGEQMLTDRFDVADVVAFTDRHIERTDGPPDG